MARILVVDDDRRITSIYSRALTDQGYSVLEAHDSHQAVNFLIVNQDIPLILLDIRMPNVDGVTLYEAAKECDPRVKVLVTSAYSLEDQKRRILAADDYFEKTQSLDLLLSKVRRLFLSCRP